MPKMVQISDLANEILEAYRQEQSNALLGYKIQKNIATSNAIFRLYFSMLSVEEKERLVQKYHKAYPEIKRFLDTPEQ